jgi:CHAT domain-containing protein/tetratricopeptide (TPR) repeat protein
MIEEKLLDRFDKDLGLIPRFIGAKPRLPCEPEGNTAPPVLCPGEGKTQLNEEQLILEAREARQSGRERPQFLRNLLRAEFPEDWEKLQRKLEDVLTDRPNSPEILNDLAVIHLIRASKGQEPAGYAEAFELLERAVSAEKPPPVEAQFNRVFVLMSLGLRHEARRASCQLAKTGSADWARLAFQLLATRELRTADHPASQRSKAEVLLGEWGALSEAGDIVAARKRLTEAKNLAQGLADKSGDRLLIDAVTAIETGNSHSRWFLVRGHAAFFRGRGAKLYSTCKPEADLLQAEASLRGRTPFVAWIHLDLAICSYFDRDFVRADQAFEEIQQVLAGHHYLALQGREGWIRGLVRTGQGRFWEAEDAIHQGLDAFAAAGEIGHSIVLTSLLARNFEKLGATSEAWVYRNEALSQIDNITSVQRRYDILEESGIAAGRQNRIRLNMVILQEQLARVETASKRGEDTDDLLGYILIKLAILQSRLGDRAGALIGLDQAQVHWQNLSPSHESRERQRLDLDLTRAQIDDSLAQDVIARIDRSLEYFSGPEAEKGDRLHILQLLILRAQWHQSIGNVEAATLDFAEGLEEISRQRAQATEPEHRASFLSAKRTFLEAKVRFEMDLLRKPRQALLTIESQKTLDLPEASKVISNEAELEALISSIPAGLQILRFATLEDRLLIWILEHQRFRMESRHISHQQLKTTIERCRDAAQTSALTETLSACDNLAELLLPLNFETATPETVMLVPDLEIWGVPFSLLRPSSGSRLLIDTSQIIWFPQLPGDLRSNSRSPSAKTRSHPEAAIVLNPNSRATPFSRLPQLKDLAESREAFTQIYPRARVLVGGLATRHAVLGALASSKIFHFSGHSYRTGNLQGLVVASNDTDPGEADCLIASTDLSKQHFPKLHLAVLAACETSRTVGPDLAPFPALAESLLTAGARQILSTSWPIPDSPGAVFSKRFHLLIQMGFSSESACRQAQLELRSSTSSMYSRPSAWAGFQLFSEYPGISPYGTY